MKRNKPKKKWRIQISEYETESEDGKDDKYLLDSISKNKARIDEVK